MAKLDDIPGALTTVSDLPRVDWLRLTQWVIDELPEPEWETALAELTEQWLERVAETLDGDYEVFESDRFFILTSAGRTYASNLAQTAERALAEIFEALPDIAHVDPYRKLACLVFHDNQLYYEYIDHPDDVGELCLPDGGHAFLGREQFALVENKEGVVEEYLVSEIACSCLFQRMLPMWLEEGVKQLLVEDVLRYRNGEFFAGDRHRIRSRVDPDTRETHQKFWKGKELRRFWQGQSFGDEEGGSYMSLGLGQILSASLRSRGKDDFLRLIETASPLDGGDLAMREIYGFGVGELAGQFLGPGDWDWKPVEPMDFFGRGLLHHSNRRFKEALEDFETAIGRSEEPGWLRTTAWFLATCPDDDMRNGERAVELATRAGELTGWEEEGALDTLAAAYAEAGDFENAIKTARAAIAKSDDEWSKADAAARLELYEARKPLRED